MKTGRRKGAKAAYGEAAAVIEQKRSTAARRRMRMPFGREKMIGEAV